MADPKEKQNLVAERNGDAIRSDLIENAHASGDGALEKSDDRLEETEDEDKASDTPY